MMIAIDKTTQIAETNQITNVAESLDQLTKAFANRSRTKARRRTLLAKIRSLKIDWAKAMEASGLVGLAMISVVFAAIASLGGLAPPSFAVGYVMGAIIHLVFASMLSSQRLSNAVEQSSADTKSENVDFPVAKSA